MKNNQQILAKIKTLRIIEGMVNPQPSDPLNLLILSIDEAIADGKKRICVLQDSGEAGEAIELQDKLSRWQFARKINR